MVPGHEGPRKRAGAEDVLQICPTRMLHQLTPPPPDSSFGPLRCRRVEASFEVRPSSVLVERRWAVSAGESRNQCVSTAVSPELVVVSPFSEADIKSAGGEAGGSSYAAVRSGGNEDKPWAWTSGSEGLSSGCGERSRRAGALAWRHHSQSQGQGAGRGSPRFSAHRRVGAAQKRAAARLLVQLTTWDPQTLAE